MKIFQSTFPRGERPKVSIKSGQGVDFNPRSRVGNDHKQVFCSSYLSISIHVPAWGTTRCTRCCRRCTSYFNPRSRVGNDQIWILDQLLLTISIHVPAWGTTDFSGVDSTDPTFQSTFPRGERRIMSAAKKSA